MILRGGAWAILLCVLLGAAGRLLVKVGSSRPGLVAQLDAGRIAGVLQIIAGVFMVSRT